MVSTARTGVREGWVALFHSRTLQVSFCNIGTQITGSCACIVMEFFNLNKKTIAKKENISSFPLGKIKHVKEIS